MYKSGDSNYIRVYIDTLYFSPLNSLTGEGIFQSFYRAWDFCLGPKITRCRGTVNDWLLLWQFVFIYFQLDWFVIDDCRIVFDLMNFDFRILSSYCCLYSKKSLIPYFMNV